MIVKQLWEDIARRQRIPVKIEEFSRRIVQHRELALIHLPERVSVIGSERLRTCQMPPSEAFSQRNIVSGFLGAPGIKRSSTAVHDDRINHQFRNLVVIEA